MASLEAKRLSLQETVRLRSRRIAEDREEEQMKLGTSGPAIVHRVERGVSC